MHFILLIVMTKFHPITKWPCLRNFPIIANMKILATERPYNNIFLRNQLKIIPLHLFLFAYCINWIISEQCFAIFGCIILERVAIVFQLFASIDTISFWFNLYVSCSLVSLWFQIWIGIAFKVARISTDSLSDH